MTSVVAYTMWVIYRWTFFGKIQARLQQYHGDEELQKRANENKRF